MSLGDTARLWDWRGASQMKILSKYLENKLLSSSDFYWEGRDRILSACSEAPCHLRPSSRAPSPELLSSGIKGLFIRPPRAGLEVVWQQPVVSPPSLSLSSLPLPLDLTPGISFSCPWAQGAWGPGGHGISFSLNCPQSRHNFVCCPPPLSVHSSKGSCGIQAPVNTQRGGSGPSNEPAIASGLTHSLPFPPPQSPEELLGARPSPGERLRPRWRRGCWGEMQIKLHSPWLEKETANRFESWRWCKGESMEERVRRGWESNIYRVPTRCHVTIITIPSDLGTHQALDQEIL